VSATPARPAAGRHATAHERPGRPRRRTLISILGASLLLVALVPFLPLTLLTWSAYQREVELVESEIRASNRHIAVIAGTYLDTLLRQVREEARVAEALAPDTLPPPLVGVSWELVSGDGTVVVSQLDTGREGTACGYSSLLGGSSELTQVGPWIEGASPTVLFLGPESAAGRMVAVLDPAVLHSQLQAWTREGLDRHLYVVEGSGGLLFYSDLELSRRGADLSANPPIRRFVAGGEGDLRYVSLVSGKERLAFVHRLAEADWGVVVSADAGTRLLGLRSRYQLVGWSIGFALAAAVAILLLSSRWLARPLLDIRRALRDPERAQQAPLRVEPATRRVVEYDELVGAFDELGADFAAVERELVQAEKASLLGQLASGLAHEMGTPLNVITGNAQYLLRKAARDDPRRPMLEQIVSQAQRIAAMIRRLLDVSRPAEARLVPVDLSAVVRQTLDIVPGVSRGVEVRCDLDDEAGPVLADPKLLEHALMNLVVNACQAMPAGGRLVLVTGIETPADPVAVPLVVVMVADTGSGILPEHLPRIFEPFFTTKPHPEGTGLGLAIVDRIARQHGGRVEVDSEPGRGTVVLLRLRSVPRNGAAPKRKRREGR
jgi:signal transduction histidine kinase